MSQAPPKTRHPPFAWVPTDNQLIQMRKLNREGLGYAQVYAALCPPVSVETFRRAMRRYGIAAQPYKQRKIAP